MVYFGCITDKISVFVGYPDTYCEDLVSIATKLICIIKLLISILSRLFVNQFTFLAKKCLRTPLKTIMNLSIVIFRSNCYIYAVAMATAH